MSNAQRHVENKAKVCRGLRRILEAPASDFSTAVDAVYTSDAELLAFHPVNEATGSAGIAKSLWLPLREALPDLERREHVVVAGEYQGKDLVSMLGLVQGTFERDWLGIPATHGVVTIRYGEIHEMHGGKIRRSYALYDLLDLTRQAGVWPIVASVGAEGIWPGPETQDGAVLSAVDPAAGGRSLEVVKLMHQALLSFDGKNLDSMNHAQYWTRNFMWYGPSGIGTTRGLAGFRAHHQIPFLRAFPDRKGGQHVANIGDGAYVITGGWPSVVGTHTGSDWLGLAPTGKRIAMRVMDFYRLEGGLIAENWVPIDIIDILRQMGTDVLARVRHLSGEPPQTL